MPMLELKPTHKPVQTYYAALRQFDDLGVSHEGAVKSAFHGLLLACEFRERPRSQQDRRARTLGKLAAGDGCATG